MPNCKLCLLIVKPDVDEEKAWAGVSEAYREVWNKAGAKGEKYAEIEQLQLVSDALGLNNSDGAMALQERIDRLKADLLKMI